jgi:hypothetical protein
MVRFVDVINFSSLMNTVTFFTKWNFGISSLSQNRDSQTWKYLQFFITKSFRKNAQKQLRISTAKVCVINTSFTIVQLVFLLLLSKDGQFYDDWSSFCNKNKQTDWIEMWNDQLIFFQICYIFLCEKSSS